MATAIWASFGSGVAGLRADDSSEEEELSASGLGASKPGVASALKLLILWAKLGAVFAAAELAVLVLLGMRLVRSGVVVLVLVLALGWRMAGVVVIVVVLLLLLLLLRIVARRLVLEKSMMPRGDAIRLTLGLRGGGV